MSPYQFTALVNRLFNGYGVMVQRLHPLKFDAVCPKEAFDVHEQETRTRIFVHVSPRAR